MCLSQVTIVLRLTRLCCCHVSQSSNYCTEAHTSTPLYILRHFRLLPDYFLVYLSVIYLATAGCVASNYTRVIVNIEWQGVWKEAVVA